MWIENRNSYRKRQAVCVILGICVSLLLMTVLSDRQRVVEAKRISDAQLELADEVFRFHVLANSDSEADQELKLKVRDAVLSYFREVAFKEIDVEKCKAESIKKWVQNHLEEIEKVANKVIYFEGYDYSVSAKVVECYFPDRRYGEVLFPKGYYEALRVEIGKALGHNWWCVLYPSLCFMDATCAVVTDEGEQQLEDVLSNKSYETVTATSGKFKIKSFFYELLRTEGQMEEGQ